MRVKGRYKQSENNLIFIFLILIMKGIKTILGALAVASLLSFSFSASAQENNNRDENGKVVRGSYESNKFWDNWFLGIGGGVNAVVGNHTDFKIGGLAVDANVGKWFTPTLGLRFGYKGIKNSFDLKAGHVSLLGDGKFNQHYIHADVMWNMFESFDGYKETRFFNMIPYMQFGVLAIKNFDSPEFGAGPGLLNTFRLGNCVDLALDVNIIIAKGRCLLIPDHTKYVGLPSATLGLIFNLSKKSNFDRHSTITPVVVPLPFTADQYNALKERVAALEAENAALKDEIAALKANPKEVEKIVEVSGPATIYFDSNSAKLSVREKAHLDYYIENILAKTDNKITVTGFADSKTGNKAVNDRIAGKRAEAIKDYIVKAGVAADRIEAVNGGESNQFAKPFQLNRCVIIK